MSTRNDLPTASFTNELTPQVLATFDSSTSSVIAIFRIATQGSRTRNGGIIRQASTLLNISLPNDNAVCVARTGDYVEYPDGSKAQIITGAGKHAQWGERSVALVGSTLSNGDEIIDTPQDIALITQQAGIPMADDFLTLAG